MAFPWIFEENFELGTDGDFDSESDTGSLLDFPHYSELAAEPGLPMPWSGAYCMRIKCGDTNDHAVIEGDIDIANGETAYFRWMMYIHEDFAATANDNFSIFELQQAGGTQVYTVGATITAATDAVTLWVGEADTPETTSTAVVPKGRWVAIEVQASVDTATTTGDITVYVDGAEYVSLTTAVQNAAAVGRGVLGVQNTLATTTGSLFFDDFIADDARIYQPTIRYPQTVLLTKSGHAFVGPGKIKNVRLLSGAGTDCILRIFDTDVGNTNDASNNKLELNNTANSQLVQGDITAPVRVQRGCFVQLTGTNPRAQLEVCPQVAYFSEGAIRNYGARRTTTPRDV